MLKRPAPVPDGKSLFPVQRFSLTSKENIELAVAREFPLTIILNGQELVTLLCTPLEMPALAAGYLSSEGLLADAAEIKRITVDEDRGIARVDTVHPVALAEDTPFKRLIASGCGRGASLYSRADAAIPPVTAEITVRPQEIIKLVAEFQHHSELYSATHGVHSAALCARERSILFFEDVGRHNALDKIFGKCLLDNIPLADKLVISSGRMSSDSVYKVAKRGMPLLVSVASPTDLAVKIATDLGVTLAGRVTGSKLDVYTHPHRIQQ